MFYLMYKFSRGLFLFGLIMLLTKHTLFLFDFFFSNLSRLSNEIDCETSIHQSQYLPALRKFKSYVYVTRTYIQIYL